MTDLEITRLCAEAMGYTAIPYEDFPPGKALRVQVAIADKQSLPSAIWYWPLKDDAQAMELVKHFWLCIQPPQFDEHAMWHVWRHPKPNYTALHGRLNRAVCLCIAQMQTEKNKPEGENG